MPFPHHTRKKTFAKAQQQWLDYHGTQATSHFVHFAPENANIHVLEAGDGEPLLLLHGGNTFSALWEPLLSLLSPHIRLLAADRLGCGLSDPINYRKVDLNDHAIRFINCLLDHYQIKKISIMGNSLGGYLALNYALHHPERVNKLVLIGASAGTQPHLPRLLRLSSIPYFNRLLFAAIWAMPHSTERLFERAFVESTAHLPNLIFELTRIGLRLPGVQKGWLAVLEQVANLQGLKPDYSLIDKLQDIQHKTLLVWGDKDPFGSVSDAHHVHKALKNSQLEIVQNAGHMPWLDQDVHCATLIKNFLA